MNERNSSMPNEEEIIYYIQTLRDSIYHKLDDHIEIIDHQNRRIYEQQLLIERQNQIIDELAWQLRDLRNSVREVKEEKSKCVCLDNRSSTWYTKQMYQRTKQSGDQLKIHKEHNDEENIYESIDVKHENPSKNTKGKSDADRPPFIKLPPPPQNTVNSAIYDQKISDLMKERNSRQTFTKPISAMEPSSLFNELGPMKRTHRVLQLTDLDQVGDDTVTSEEIRQKNSTTDRRPSTVSQRIQRIEDLMKHFQLFSTQTETGGNNRESSIYIKQDDRDIDNMVLLRERNLHRNFSGNRGSSKVMCSLVSDIDADYLPNEPRLTEDEFLNFDLSSSVHFIEENDQFDRGVDTVDVNIKKSNNNQPNSNRLAAIKH